MRTEKYTLEIYYPPYPSKGRLARIHKGGFEDVRDSLSPDMTNIFPLDVHDLRSARILAKSMILSDVKLEKNLA